MGAGLFGAIEHRYCPGAFRQRCQQVGGRERAIETHFQHADFLAAAQQFINHLFAGADGRAHNDDHTLCLRVAVKLKRFVLAAGGGGEVIHRFFDMIIDRVVPRVGGLPRLEVGVGVSRGPADHRVFRIKRALTMLGDLILWQQGANGVIRQRGDFVDFVRGAETIKEMNKRHPALQGGDMRDQREILCFLDAAGAQHRTPGLTDGHNIGMVAEDRQRVGGDGAGGDVQDKRHQLAGQFVQRGNHQQQALR